ncbi:MAG: type II secretion system protein [Polyangiaceae bacterium]
MTTSARERATRRKRLALGYTAIEIMISMSVFAVGAAGVIGMLRSSVQGNVDARKLDLANSIARTWVERLRRASTTWTLPGGSNQTVSNMGSSNNDAEWLLNGHLNAGWFVPNATTLGSSGPSVEGNSAAFDLLGRDLAISDWDANAEFCTHVKLDCAVANPNTSGPVTCPLIRATVRVFWPRKISGAPHTGFCSDAKITAVQDNAGDLYHFVYVTSAIRQNPTQ